MAVAVSGDATMKERLKVVFQATLSLVVDRSRWWVYSYRGHRWTF